MLACWVEDPNGDCFKKHLARIPDYLWISEGGMKMQGCGCQQWDTGLAIQALLASDLANEIGGTLKKGHDFIKKSQVDICQIISSMWFSLSLDEYLYQAVYAQVKENPSGDFRRMYRHISKGSWTFSDQDQGWQVSDCTAEAMKVLIFIQKSANSSNLTISSLSCICFLSLSVVFSYQ